MPRRSKFALIFAPEALEHLDAIPRKYHRLIQHNIDEQLIYTPLKETSYLSLERSLSYESCACS
jgi:hypothetical protein